MRWDDIPSRVTYAGTFSPSPGTRARYDGLFDVFEDVYKKNKGIFARLNRDALHSRD
jgi:hypothetical protein